jgi:mitogen-activated protein kinase 1/3
VRSVTAEEALADPYFAGLHDPAREPTAEPISKLEFEFEKRKLTVEEVRELIYREVLEYHPQAKREASGGEAASNFVFPSAVDAFKRQFAHLEGASAAGGGAGAVEGAGPVRELRRQAQSMPREQMAGYRHETSKHLLRSDTINTHDPHAAGAPGTEADAMAE